MKQFRTLMGFALKKDYKKIILWQLGLLALFIMAANKVAALYVNKASIAAMFQTLKTPAMIAILGKFSLTQSASVASLYAAEMLVFTSLIITIMNISIALHSLSNQENGASELLNAAIKSKNSVLAVSFCEMVIVNLITSVVCYISLVIVNLPGATLAGNLLFSLAMGCFGLFFSMVVFLVCQLVSNNQATISYVILAVLFVARMLTDVRNPDYTSWTIYGLIEKLNVYISNNYQPVLILFALTLIFCAVAYLLHRNKDWGVGIIPSFAYHKKSSKLLSNQFTLVSRLNIVSVLAWIIGLVLLGIMYGSIYGDIGNLLKSNPTLGRIISKAAVHESNKIVIFAFTNKIATIFAILATIPGLNVINKLNTDEQKGYLELIHSSQSRLKTYLSYLINAYLIAGIVFILGASSLIVSGQKNSLVGNINLARLWRIVPGYLSSALAVLAIASLIMAFLPKFQKLSWILPLYGVFTSYLGGILKLPKWMNKLTPYGWVNNVPTACVDWKQVSLILCLIIALSIVSYYGYKNRDLLVN